jgi:hypothetical protein
MAEPSSSIPLAAKPSSAGVCPLIISNVTFYSDTATEVKVIIEKDGTKPNEIWRR